VIETRLQYASSSPPPSSIWRKISSWGSWQCRGPQDPEGSVNLRVASARPTTPPKDSPGSDAALLHSPECVGQRTMRSLWGSCTEKGG